MEIKKIDLPFKVKKPVLALGSQTKNTVCFARGDTALMSAIHSDLSNPEDFLDFEKTVKYFLSKKPQIIAYDLHPEYQSTKYALRLPPTAYDLLPLQHHHAHIASCMAENGLKNQKVIGIAFDGTGLGADNTLWGAEFFVCDYRNSLRSGHLREIPLLGAERAIQEPWRLTAFWLDKIYKDRFLNLGIGFVKKINQKKWKVLKSMYEKGFNAPLASSMGRLFDAAASLLLEKPFCSFEAELAIELERIATEYREPFDYAQGRQSTEYRFEINKSEGVYIIDPSNIFRQIVLELKAKAPKEKIAYRFHLTVAKMLSRICRILRRETKINRVVLSGGVFQNKLLLGLSLDLLCRDGFKAFTHKKIPSSDAGVSLGEAAIASFRS